MKNCLMTCVAAMLITSPSRAVDGTARVSNVEPVGHWQVIQFAMPQAMLFRISTISIDDQKKSMTMDLTDKCDAGSLTMEWKTSSHRNFGDIRFLILEYKVPGDPENYPDVATGETSAGFLFLTLKGLSIQKLYATHGSGNLAVWIPASGDGAVKRSDNIYFSMDGLPGAFDRAKKLCQANR